MSKITASSSISQVKPDLTEVQRYVDIFCNNVVQVVNGNLDFATNFNNKFVTASFGAANSEIAVPHGLGRVPAGYMVIGSTAAMSVYNGLSTNSSILLYLRASAIGDASLIVF